MVNPFGTYVQDFSEKIASRFKIQRSCGVTRACSAAAMLKKVTVVVYMCWARCCRISLCDNWKGDSYLLCCRRRKNSFVLECTKRWNTARVDKKRALMRLCLTGRSRYRSMLLWRTYSGGWRCIVQACIEKKKIMKCWGASLLWFLTVAAYMEEEKGQIWNKAFLWRNYLYYGRKIWNLSGTCLVGKDESWKCEWSESIVYIVYENAW